MVKRIYIAGPMSHYPGHNYDSFRETEVLLQRAGFETENPAAPDDTLDDVRPWAYYMRRALHQLADCDGVALLDGWEASRGARLEVHVAHALGMPTLPLKLWLTS